MIADFGTDYTSIGWLTIVLPVGFVGLVATYLWRAFKREKPEGQSPDAADR
jgi:hypothetical protein